MAVTSTPPDAISVVGAVSVELDGESEIAAALRWQCVSSVNDAWQIVLDRYRNGPVGALTDFDGTGL